MKVALINMPFASRERPSIQLGILKSILNSLEVESDTFYFNREFAERIGHSSYYILASKSPRLLPEWIFARKTWGERRLVDTGYEHFDGEHEARFEAEKFIDEIVNSRDWNEYEIIAFTCVFDQISSALCLGRHIKTKFPNIITMYGGANLFESATLEFLSKVDWMDIVFTGEAEESFRAVMQSLRDGEPLPPSIKGFAYKDGKDVVCHGSSILHDMNQSPCPDYSDFFNLIGKEESVTMPYETARGCWYGEKKQCKFCSLNLEGMEFRHKSPENSYKDIVHLWKKWGEYKIDRIYIVDNILEKSYIQTLLPMLKGEGIKFFWEVKPDMTGREIETLANAGVTCVQPGIENFDRDLIRIQDKGQSVLNCVTLLKWCKYFNIRVSYNLLTQIPFEEDEWIDRQLLFMRKLTHFRPPNTCDISIERFGVYYQKNLLSDIRPLHEYNYIYPEHIDLDKIAYYFDYDIDRHTCGSKKLMTESLIYRWKVGGWRSLRFVSETTILDRRFSEKRVHDLSIRDREIVKFCTEPTTKKEIQSRFDLYKMDHLIEKDLIEHMEGKYLSLVEIEDGDLSYCRRKDRTNQPKSKNLPVLSTHER